MPAHRTRQRGPQPPGREYAHNRRPHRSREGEGRRIIREAAATEFERKPRRQTDVDQLVAHGLSPHEIAEATGLPIHEVLDKPQGLLRTHETHVARRAGGER